jgi:hypothetical protein
MAELDADTALVLTISEAMRHDPAADQANQADQTTGNADMQNEQDRLPAENALTIKKEQDEDDVKPRIW